MNGFSTASARGLFDYDLNDRTRNNGAKLIVKYFNTSVAQHLYKIKITTWNALPNEVVSSKQWTLSRTVWTTLGRKSSSYPSELVAIMMPCIIQGLTNSRRPAFCWKWTQRSVLLQILIIIRAGSTYE